RDDGSIPPAICFSNGTPPSIPSTAKPAPSRTERYGYVTRSARPLSNASSNATWRHRDLSVKTLRRSTIRATPQDVCNDYELKDELVGEQITFSKQRGQVCRTER